MGEGARVWRRPTPLVHPPGRPAWEPPLVPGIGGMGRAGMSSTGNTPARASGGVSGGGHDNGRASRCLCTRAHLAEAAPTLLAACPRASWPHGRAWRRAYWAAASVCVCACVRLQRGRRAGGASGHGRACATGPATHPLTPPRPCRARRQSLHRPTPLERGADLGRHSQAASEAARRRSLCCVHQVVHSALAAALRGQAVAGWRLCANGRPANGVGRANDSPLRRAVRLCLKVGGGAHALTGLISGRRRRIGRARSRRERRHVVARARERIAAPGRLPSHPHPGVSVWRGAGVVHTRAAVQTARVALPRSHGVA